MATKSLVVGLTAVGLTLGAAVWAATPPRTSGNVDEAAIGDSTPTFYKDVLPIVQQHCQTCHRPGQIGPFSLLDYQSARPWAKAIKSAVATKKMPPWFANPEYGHFDNDRSLKQAEIDTIVEVPSLTMEAGHREKAPWSRGPSAAPWRRGARAGQTSAAAINFVTCPG